MAAVARGGCCANPRMQQNQASMENLGASKLHLMRHELAVLEGTMPPEQVHPHSVCAAVGSERGLHGI